MLQIEVEPTSEVRWLDSLLCLTGLYFIYILGHISQEPVKLSICAVKLLIIELMARPDPAQASVSPPHEEGPSWASSLHSSL